MHTDDIEKAPSRRVFALGVFDLFHVGHLRYIQYARAQGTHLTVAVTPDAISLAIKGKLPMVPESQRLEIVSGLRGVDETRLLPVSTEYAPEAADWIASLRIDLVVAGGGWQGSPRWNRLVPILNERNIDVIFAPVTEGLSTTELIARVRQTGHVGGLTGDVRESASGCPAA